MVTDTNTRLTVEAPAGVDNIECRPRKDMACGNWKSPTSSNLEVQEQNGKSQLKFDLFQSLSNKWLFTYKCTITVAQAQDVEMSQLYKVGNMMPSHHYNFDMPRVKDAPPQTVPSLSYSGAQTKAFVDSASEGDISLVRSPFSTGYAMQFNGGSLWLDDMSKVYKGDFTVCSRVQTTVTGTEKLWLSPSLIGKENPGSTSDMFLFTINSRGQTGIALGDRYGAMSSQPVNDGEQRYICVSRDLKTDDGGTVSSTRVYVNGVPDGDPVEIFHKGHSALENDPDARKAPDADLTIDLDTIGYTASENTDDKPIAFTSTIDDLEITPFAMTDQQIADAYTHHLQVPMAKGGFAPVGLMAVTSSPLLTSASQVKVTFHHAAKEEATVVDGRDKVSMKEVQDQPLEFECEVNGKTETYNLNSSFVLENPDFNTFRTFRCKTSDTDVSAYRVSFDDPSKGSVAESLLLIGNSKGSGLYFDGIVHDGLSQSGNSPLEPRPTPDYFIAEKSAMLENVGAEDLVILDTMPEMRDLLGRDTPVEIETALNELVHCTHSTVKSLSQDVTESDTAASLTINTIAPDQPVTAYLAGELYTINPDHIV